MQFPKCLEVLDASGSNFDVTTIEDFPNVTDLDLRDATLKSNCRFPVSVERLDISMTGWSGNLE